MHDINACVNSDFMAYSRLLSEYRMLFEDGNETKRNIFLIKSSINSIKYIDTPTDEEKALHDSLYVL